MDIIQSLNITCFRNHLDLAITSKAKFIVILGPNGAGKTSILEAISMFAPGRGLRSAKLTDMIKCDQQFGAQWGIQAELTRNSDLYSIHSGYTKLTGGSKRIIKIDSNPITKQSDLLKYLRIIWITPQMDRVFAEASGTRRAMLDRLTYNFFPEHSQDVLAYNYYAKTRLHALAQPSWDLTWLDSTEKQIATLSLKLIKHRAQCIELLQYSLAKQHSFIPVILKLEHNIAADILHGDNVLNDVVRQLKAARRKDSYYGKNSVAPHKSDLKLIHPVKQLETGLCSTGEQKSMMISVILAQARSLTDVYKFQPIILLDDPLEHLDKEKISNLFASLQDTGCQVWVSTTQDSLLDLLQQDVQVISL